MIDSDDVLVARIASGLRTGASAAKISRFTASFSVAASMTRSASARPSTSALVAIRFSAALRSASGTFPDETCRAMLPWMVARLDLRRSSETSWTTTS